MNSAHKEHISKFPKYVFANSLTFVGDLALVRLGITCGLPLLYTGFVSFIVMSIVSYFLLHHWVFHDHTTTYSRASVLFACLVLVQALMVGFGLRYTLFHLQVLPEVARVLVGIFVGLFGYIVCHYVIFIKEA